MMQKNTFVALRDGTQISVPDDLSKMSHYVLSEQGDWFEDEIHFVRRFIEPGMQALDIGANYGLYTCAILKKFNGTGHLWCFEPTPDTASALRQSIEKNNFQERVTLIEAGLSNQCGSATFYTSPNSELNSLTKFDGLAQDNAHTIQLKTLDSCLEEYQWGKLDFIKLDAEGEEVRILEAGQKTLQELSPLVMFELKHGNDINHELIRSFEALGFGIYRMIPGLEVLVPVVVESGFDSFQLNLFACKPDRAELLKAKGLLVELMPALKCATPIQAEQLPRLAAFSTLKLAPEDATGESYFSLLASFLAACNDSLPIQQRYQHLLFAHDLVKPIWEAKETSIERLSTIARVAFDFGSRQLGIAILEFLIKRYFQTAGAIEVRDAFVQPCAQMDAVRIGSNLVTWLCSGVLDAMIRKHAYSCYFTGPQMIPFMKRLEQTRYLHPDIAQRIVTMKMAIQASSNTVAHKESENS